MKALWKGSISFGLVNIPIQLFTATESHVISFTLLHEACHTPLKYHRWCPHCEEEVSWDQTVKALKNSTGSNHIFTNEELKALHPEKTETIDIVEFIDENKIPVIYLNHHYYAIPKKEDDKAYSLFVKALEKTNKAAIGRFVLREKEYICSLQSRENYLVLTTLYYPQEIRGIQALAMPKKAKISPAELKLAQELIEKLSVKDINMNQFKDTFAQEIKALAKKKTKPRKAKVTPRRKKKTTLTESLHASLKNIAVDHHINVSHRASAHKRH